MSNSFIKKFKNQFFNLHLVNSLIYIFKNKMFTYRLHNYNKNIKCNLFKRNNHKSNHNSSYGNNVLNKLRSRYRYNKDSYHHNRHYSSSSRRIYKIEMENSKVLFKIVTYYLKYLLTSFLFYNDTQI